MSGQITGNTSPSTNYQTKNRQTNYSFAPLGRETNGGLLSKRHLQQSVRNNNATIERRKPQLLEFQPNLNNIKQINNYILGPNYQSKNLEKNLIWFSFIFKLFYVDASS